jgi:hypothetical protein
LGTVVISEFDQALIERLIEFVDVKSCDEAMKDESKSKTKQKEKEKEREANANANPKQKPEQNQKRRPN